MVEHFRVGILVGMAYQYTRDVFGGVVRFQRENQRWRLWHTIEVGERVAAGLPELDGVILMARGNMLQLADSLIERGVHVVNVSGSHEAADALPTVRMNDLEIGEMAARHLLDKGFRQATCLDFPAIALLHRRADRFGKTIVEAGATLLPPFVHNRGASVNEWCRALPTGTGVFCLDDANGIELMGSFRAAGRLIPEDIAVIGAGNDTTICQAISPSLSSVMLEAERVGYQAASLLDRLLRGDPVSKKLIRYSPVGVKQRHSTDILALEDPDFAQALRFIRDHACQNISVADVVRELAVNRRWLERQFRNALRTTPAREIRRIRVQHAKELLLGTDLTVTQVGAKCGFTHPRNFGDFFKAATEKPPGTFRSENR